MKLGTRRKWIEDYQPIASKYLGGVFSPLIDANPYANKTIMLSSSSLGERGRFLVAELFFDLFRARTGSGAESVKRPNGRKVKNGIPSASGSKAATT